MPEWLFVEVLGIDSMSSENPNLGTSPSAAAIEILRTALALAELEAEEFDRNSNREIFDPDTLMVARVTGAHLQGAHAILKANASICNISIYMPIPPKLTSAQRLRMFEDFLRLNFQSSIGRISLASYRRSNEQIEPTEIVFAETMFFWKYAGGCTDLLRSEIHQRLANLVSLSNEAKSIMSRIVKLSTTTSG